MNARKKVPVKPEPESLLFGVRCMDCSETIDFHFVRCNRCFKARMDAGSLTVRDPDANTLFPPDADF